MGPGLAAVLGGVGGALAGFVGATVVAHLAVGNAEDDEEVRHYLLAHPELTVGEARASMRNLKTTFAAGAAVMGAVVGGALSASVAKTPEQAPA